MQEKPQEDITFCFSLTKLMSQSTVELLKTKLTINKLCTYFPQIVFPRERCILAT